MRVTTTGRIVDRSELYPRSLLASCHHVVATVTSSGANREHRPAEKPAALQRDARPRDRRGWTNLQRPSLHGFALAHRWRDALLHNLRSALMARLKVSEAESESILRLAMSGVELTFARYFGV